MKLMTKLFLMLSYHKYHVGFSALDGMELNFCSPAEYNAASAQRSSRDVKEYLSSSDNAFSSGEVTGRVLVSAKGAARKTDYRRERTSWEAQNSLSFRPCQS